MTKDHHPTLDWRNDVIPIAARFDDPYFSLDNGLAETQFVFLQGNNLPERFSDGFHVAELGFGTGLNLLTTLASWRQSGILGRLKFTSFEAFPMQHADMLRALAAFPELGDIVSELGPLLHQQSIDLHDLEFRLITGDARDTLTLWDEVADAWFLDGFSPAKNPELWEAKLLNDVGRHTAPSGTFATYTAAGFIRQNLTDAGFDVERVKGFGRKRHMTIGRMP